MIDQLEETTLTALNERIDQINSELKRIRSGQNVMVLPSEQPREPGEGQMWMDSGTIKVFRSNGIETYSKD